MRQYILDFEQKKLLALGIDLKQALILDYVQKFSKSMSVKTIQQNGKTYFWLKYSKLQQDLPILNLKRRHLYNLIEKLVKIGILDKIIIGKRMAYLAVVKEVYENAGKGEMNTDQNTGVGNTLPTNNIDGNILPLENNLLVTDFIHVGKKLLAIVNYNKQLNYINISVTNEDVLGLDKDFFLSYFKQMLQNEFSAISYELIYKDAQVQKQDYVFTLSLKSVQMVLLGKETFVLALKKSLMHCLKINDE